MKHPLVLLVLFVIVAYAINVTFFPDAKFPGVASVASVDDYDACWMAQKFVKDQLKAPSTANFAPCREPDSVVTGNGRVWQVDSWVDAQNGFGAQLRTDFTARLVYYPDTEKWTLMSLDMLD